MFQQNSEDRRMSISPKASDFISGVVEGFYGRPWTLDQRKHLMHRLSHLGMNTYFYAPKDDLKHRAEWRLLYTAEETDTLEVLIKSAKDNGITFVYALSPGLDISYSNNKEIDCIQKKLEQVRKLGCESFALLFDDIEANMNEADKKHFITFAAAQVSVTNEIYKHLNAPQFFFCPTEYCETRAVPTLENSDYLQTLGTRLIKDIHILWTGPRVVSRILTTEHIEKVTQVIGRKPLIWDNLHANDYDPKRVFLGPFSGRPVKLKHCLSGLLLNPNCKYEANFVPIHTLADWIAADEDATVEPNTSAILEAGSASPVAAKTVEAAIPAKLYHPLSSANSAIKLWIGEFSSTSGPTIPPIPRIEGDVDMDLTKTETITTTTTSHDASLLFEEIIQSSVANKVDPELNHPVNSLVADYGEPMECTTGAASRENTIDMEDETAIDDAMETEKSVVADFEQICTLVDIFYLPFENGRRGNCLLEELTWLYENAMVMTVATIDEESRLLTQSEWTRRYDAVEAVVNDINRLFRYIIECPNKPLVSEIIPYAWELHGLCSVLLGIARWFRNGLMLSQPEDQPRFWNVSMEDEPWNNNGGFLVDCCKVLASHGSVMQLFTNKSILPISIISYEVRPFTVDDLQVVASMVQEDDITQDEEIMQFRRELFVERYIAPFVDVQSHHCFMAEEVFDDNERKTICVACAYEDGRSIFKQLNEHVRSMRDNFRGRYVLGVDALEYLLEAELWYPNMPDEIFNTYPAWLEVRFEGNPYDAVPAKRLIQAIGATLAINGCPGMVVAVPHNLIEHISFYTRLGFNEVGRTEDQKYILFGHLLATNTGSSEDLTTN